MSGIESVKAAIAEKLAPAIDLRAPYAKVMVEAAARAAIEAMREPTAAMLVAGEVEYAGQSYGEDGILTLESHVAIKAYQAMIDEMLK